MGNLKPGATYIYERANGVIYARESGNTERQVVGYEYENGCDPRTSGGRPMHEHMMEDKMWGEIRRAAVTNPTLQDALDYVIMVHNLSKRNE